ncbi:MAG: hypothetical protein AMXMBFR84_23000 [Candidatus Hydrogenedentota bacterium]
MSSEFDRVQEVEEPKERTMLMWAGVIVLFFALLGALWWLTKPDSKVSYLRIQHILIKPDSPTPAAKARALELCRGLRERIVQGERFETLAKQYSNDPLSASRGGYLSRSYKNDLDAKIEAYAWAAPLGELSEVIESTFGYHIVKVVERYVAPTEQFLQEQEKQINQEFAPKPTE